MFSKLATFLPIIALVIFTASLSAAAQKEPSFKSYRGIWIGMTKDAVRKAIGKPKDEFADEDDYEFSSDEIARIFYNADQTVRAIVVVFSGDLRKAPTPLEVLAEDIEISAEGNAYKMIRFPDKGYWASYLRMGGDKPSITVTVQFLPKT